jgi:hypothetical protein
MMSAIEKKSLIDRQRGGSDERLEDWDGGEKGEWENVNAPSGGLSSRGYSTLGKRLVQGRTSHWGMSGEKKKASSLRSVVI